jgi:uncharacterized delta-60 repeat protein
MKKIFILINILLSGLSLSAQSQMVLDSTFSEDGQALYFPTTWEGKGILTQPDGKIIVYGNNVSLSSNFRDIRLLRLHPDGTPDSSFNQTGNVLTDLAHSHFFSVWQGLLQPDGKLLIAGIGGEANTQAEQPVLVRYNSNGSLDSLFGVQGLVIAPQDGFFYSGVDMVLQDDGKIIVICKSDSNVNVIRFNADGNLDDSFGTNGISAISDAYIIQYSDFDIDSHGVIYVLGTEIIGGQARSTIIVLNPDGLIVGDIPIGTLFDTEVNFDLFNTQLDGEIIAVGKDILGTNIIKFRPDGTLISSFSKDGIVLEPFGSDYYFPRKLKLGQGNKILIYFGPQYYMVRFNSNGSLDYSLNGGGLFEAFIPPGGEPNGSHGSFDIETQADGKILVGASTGGKLYMARYKIRHCPE